MLKNLAGVANCYEHIKHELERARIPIRQVKKSTGEIPYTLIGRLPGSLAPFRFIRLEKCWIVHGPVLLEVVEILCADPVGKDDIHLVSPECDSHDWRPSEMARWLLPRTDQELSDRQQQAVNKFKESGGSEYPEWYGVVSDDPASIGAEPYVYELYVDSEVGLRVFVDTLFKHELASEPKKPRAELVAV